MASVGQNILVVSIAVIGSMLFQAGLNHIWPWEKRRTYVDLEGSGAKMVRVFLF